MEIPVTAIKPVRIGQVENAEAGTGCTVLIVEHGMAAGLDVRGGGPASRESQLLNPLMAAQTIHAVVLSGGSATENLLTVCAIAIIFAIRKFLFVESFEFTNSDKPVDWLSDWKEMRKGGSSGDKKVKNQADSESKYTEI